MNKDKWIKYGLVNSFPNHFSLLYIYYSFLKLLWLSFIDLYINKLIITNKLFDNSNSGKKPNV